MASKVLLLLMACLAIGSTFRINNQDTSMDELLHKFDLLQSKVRRLESSRNKIQIYSFGFKILFKLELFTYRF